MWFYVSFTLNRTCCTVNVLLVEVLLKSHPPASNLPASEDLWRLLARIRTCFTEALKTWTNLTVTPSSRADVWAARLYHEKPPGHCLWCCSKITGRVFAIALNGLLVLDFFKSVKERRWCCCYYCYCERKGIVFTKMEKPKPGVMFLSHSCLLF